MTTVGSITEAMFREQAADAGWIVSKRGWPDFILRRGNEICFVETKSYPGTKLKREQQDVAEILAAAGLKVYRWDPETGFVRIKKESQTQALSRPATP